MTDSNPSAKKSSIRSTAIIVTTAMLSFISFWRAGAIVLCDLGSSAFYAGGIAEQAIGKAAPWFILGIMLFSNCVRLVYIESCTLFVRGGVYKVVKRAMGGTLGKLSVSALIFDYILTGPISAVAAGQYLVSFLNELTLYFHLPLHFDRNTFSALFAVIVILYFWRKNIIGIEESSDKALKILIATAVVGAVVIGLSVATVWIRGFTLPPIQPVLNEESLGWLKGFEWAKTIPLIGIMIGMGHSLLAMSGEESLAQVYREIEAPKLKNLKKAAILIGVFSFLFTGVITFFAMVIIPDNVRMIQYSENLIGGLAMHVIGPEPVRLILHGLVVLVGFLLLSGAVNTSIIGSNGVLNRVSEDGVLTDWFRIPHKRYGSTSNIINLIVILQLVTILICRGDIYILGEAYAFGVVWSFTFKTLAMLILRFKDKTPREWKVPLNIPIGNTEIPVGLGLIFLVLFGFAIINLFTKTVATTWGVVFSISFFILFTISEKINRKHRKVLVLGHEHDIEYEEKVNLRLEETLTPQCCGLTAQRRILITARDPHNLYHAKKALEEFDPDTTDCIIMTAKMTRPYEIEGDMATLYPEEQSLLTYVVNLAETAGKKVTPILVSAKDPLFAISKVASELDVDEIIVGRSEKMSAEHQLETLAMSWGALQGHSPKGIKIRVIWEGRELTYQI